MRNNVKVNKQTHIADIYPCAAKRTMDASIGNIGNG